MKRLMTFHEVIMINLAILNSYNPILAFEAISEKLLVYNNEELYAAFYSLTCRSHEDKMMRINRSTQNSKHLDHP